MYQIFIINCFVLIIILLFPLIEEIFGVLNKDISKFLNQNKENRVKKFFNEKEKSVRYKDVAEKLYLSPNTVQGFCTQSAVRCPYSVFIFFSTLGALTLACIVTLVWMQGILQLNGYNFSGLLLLSLFVGVYMPHACFLAIIKTRVQAVDKHIASFIDLILICLDAGLTLNQSLVFVANECKRTSPLLATELERTNLDCSLFLNTSRAFANLLERVPSKKIGQFVAVVQQHHSEGSVIYDSLYQMSITVYRDNMSIIEERAQKMPGILSAMAVIFTIPMIFIVAFGPYIQDLMELFG